MAELLISDLGELKGYVSEDYISQPVIHELDTKLASSLTIEQYENFITYNYEIEEGAEVVVEEEADFVVVGSGVDTEMYPIGTILFYPSLYRIPKGWLLCNGNKVYKEHYQELWNIIGDRYSLGESDIEIFRFRLPNLKGRVVMGVNEEDEDFKEVGIYGGEEYHTLTIDEMPRHNHKANLPNGYVNSGFYDNLSYQKGGTMYSSYEGGDQPHPNMPPYIVLNYIIKAKPTRKF